GSVSEAGIVHRDLYSCPGPAAQPMRMLAVGRAANFNMSLAFWKRGALDFLEAQAGEYCQETMGAYDGYVSGQTDLFVSLWLGMTGRVAATCRAAAQPAPGR
ncbi:MAG: hypothetical protein PHF00_14055, partial [Elusimicrobia bacterium]|nr:hypothetical protein [Elusimicrobiota bacterium]